MKTIITIAILCTALCSYAQLSTTVIYNFSGTTTDISGNGNDGTLHGGATDVSNLKIGNNDVDYLDIPAGVISGMDDFTVGFRIKFAQFHLDGSFPTNHIFSGSKSGCVQCFGFAYEKPLNVWKLAVNGTVYTWDDNDVAEGEWYCVMISRINDTISLYIEGELLGSVVDGSAIDITSFLIGQEDDCTGGCFVTNQCMNGRLDNFQIWNGYHYGCNYKAHASKTIMTFNNGEFENPGNIYPNPAKDFVTVLLNEKADNEIKIINLHGEILYNAKINDRSVQIDISQYPSGIYMVEVNTDTKSTSSKLIVTK